MSSSIICFLSCIFRPSFLFLIPPAEGTGGKPVRSCCVMYAAAVLYVRLRRPSASIIPHLWVSAQGVFPYYFFAPKKAGGLFIGYFPVFFGCQLLNHVEKGETV